MDSPASADFYAAISTVALAQLSHSLGFTSSTPATLRALSDIALRYLLSIGRLSASSAASHCRTHCNLLDLVVALETLFSHRGFPSRSDPTSPLLDSLVLKELMAFVRVRDQLPFAKSIIKDTSSTNSFSSSRSFAHFGKEVPVPHVPRWLPCFPESWEARDNESKEETLSVAEVVNINGDVERGLRIIRSDRRRLSCGFDDDDDDDRGFNLVDKRDKIKFTIEFPSVLGKKRRIRMNSCNLEASFID